MRSSEFTTPFDRKVFGTCPWRSSDLNRAHVRRLMPEGIEAA
jgi:hypothetical protein